MEEGREKEYWLKHAIYLTAPAYTASLDAAMTLIPEGLQLAIYTNWVLTAGYPENERGGVTLTDDMPRGCWVRSYDFDQRFKNIEGIGRSDALAVTAIALRALAAQGSQQG